MEVVLFGDLAYYTHTEGGSYAGNQLFEFVYLNLFLDKTVCKGACARIPSCVYSKYMKVRKNITLSEKADRFLKELAEETGKSQSEVIEELILREVEEKEKEKRLRAFKDFVESVRGMKISLGEEVTFQKAKEIMGVEKYL